MKSLFAASAAFLLAAAPAVAQQAHQDHHGHGVQHAVDAAQSHGVTTVPADGAMTDGSPEWFTATFPHPMRLTAVTVTSQGGRPVDVPVAAAAATTRVAARLPRLAPGDHVLNWTAEGADGHRMIGIVRFMVH